MFSGCKLDVAVLPSQVPPPGSDGRALLPAASEVQGRVVSLAGSALYTWGTRGQGRRHLGALQPPLPGQSLLWDHCSSPKPRASSQNRQLVVLRAVTTLFLLCLTRESYSPDVPWARYSGLRSADVFGSSRSQDLAGLEMGTLVWLMMRLHLWR